MMGIVHASRELLLNLNTPMRDEMDQISATEALGCWWVPIRRLRKTSVIVVGHTYRVIYITGPSQNLKNLEICPDRDPREPKPFPLVVGSTSEGWEDAKEWTELTEASVVWSWLSRLIWWDVDTSPPRNTKSSTWRVHR